MNRINIAAGDFSGAEEKTFAMTTKKPPMMQPVGSGAFGVVSGEATEIRDAKHHPLTPSQQQRGEGREGVAEAPVLEVVQGRQEQQEQPQQQQGKRLPPHLRHHHPPPADQQKEGAERQVQLQQQEILLRPHHQLNDLKECVSQNSHLCLLSRSLT